MTSFPHITSDTGNTGAVTPATEDSVVDELQGALGLLLRVAVRVLWRSKRGRAVLLFLTVILPVLAFSVVNVGLPAAGVDTQPVTSDAPVVTVVAPASPGLTKALDICKLGMVSKVAMPERAGDYRYTAIFGLDVMSWPDSPRGKNPIGLLNGEALTFSEDLQKCLKERA